MQRLVLLSLVTIVIACNPSTESVPTTRAQATQATATEPPVPTQTALIVESPDLTQSPLYWFAPLPPLPTGGGRPYTGSDDFMQLFEPDAPWQTASSQLQVFKLYGEWVINHPADSHLKKAISDLNRRGLAIAIETGPLDPEPGCGENIEGFATVASSLDMVDAIKAAGGRLSLIALDEPYFYGHLYDGPNACHWNAEKIALEVDEFIKAVRGVFPEVIVGDIEPLADPAGAKEYQDWLAAFHAVNGYHLAFIHLEVDWSRPKWTEEVKAIQEYGKMIGVPVGIIYNGNAFDKTDEAFLAATGERVKKLELVTGVRPDHVIFQSWNDKPDRVLPETDPFSYTGFINSYFSDKASLGYKRDGEGANLALGKTVKFSSQIGGEETGALAVDGEFGTLWNSGGEPIQWFEIDLGDAYNISEIRLTTAQYPAGKTVHHLLAKGKNSQYILLSTFEGNTDDGHTLVFTPPEPIRDIQFIRVETIESPSWVAWREIEVIRAGE